MKDWSDCCYNQLDPKNYNGVITISVLVHYFRILLGKYLTAKISAELVCKTYTQLGILSECDTKHFYFDFWDIFGISEKRSAEHNMTQLC